MIDHERPSIERKFIELARAPSGVGTMSLPGVAQKRAHNILKALARAEKLVIVKLGHRTVRYFADPEAAIQWRRLNAGTISIRPVAQRLNANLPVVIPDNVRITYGPPFVPRFQSCDAPGLTQVIQRGRVTA